MKIWVFCFIFFQNLLALGQSEMGITVNYSRLDAFHGLEFTYSKERFLVFTGLEAGINRTYLQKRFFPRMKAGFGYAVIAKEKFQLQPVIQYSYALLLFNKTTHSFAHYHELSTGLRWRYGKRWKIGQTVLIGALWERSYNTLYQHSRAATTLGYTAQIDFIYAF